MMPKSIRSAATLGVVLLVNGLACNRRLPKAEP
jgi:hypothetical protein